MNGVLRFNQTHIKHLPAVQLDHCPIFISPNGFAPLQVSSRPLRFQATLMSHENFKAFLHDNWKKELPLVPGLAKLSTDLQKWNKEIFGNIFQQKRVLLG